MSLIENTLYKFSEIKLISYLINVFLMDVVIERPLVLAQRWKHSILRIRVSIRTLWLLFDASPRDIRSHRWLTQSSVMNQCSILLLLLFILWGELNLEELTDVVLHVPFDDAVLEGLCVNH